MTEVNEKKIENKKIRKYADKLTIGILEDADIPISRLQKIINKEREPTTGDFQIIRLLANASMIEGEPFTRDMPMESLVELLEFRKSFLAKSRLKSAKETLKQKRSPKP